MTISVLGPGGYSRPPYGSFAGKTAFVAPTDVGLGPTVLMPSGTLSRERFRAIAAAERAAHAAEAKARLLKKKQKEALDAAAEVAEEVISRSGLLAEFAIEPLTEALEAATSANVSQIIALANQARAIAENMLAAMEDDEEDIMILIWALQ